jgi:hypothetical protein
VGKQQGRSNGSVCDGGVREKRLWARSEKLKKLLAVSKPRYIRRLIDEYRRARNGRPMPHLFIG